MRLLKIIWNATTLTFTIPPRTWRPGTVAVGAGSETSASGVPAAWVTRRDYTLRIPLRFTESEWPAVRAWLEYAQAGGSFDVYPDSAAVTAYTCYLAEPRIDEPLEPDPGEYFGSMELSVLVRTTAGTAIEPAYFNG